MTLEEEIISLRLRELEAAANALPDLERTGVEPRVELPTLQTTVFEQAAEAWVFQT